MSAEKISLPPNRPRLRRLFYFLLVLGGVLLVRHFWPVPAATRTAWFADLDRLEVHTAAAYANLGDRLASRKLSPRELDAQARAALATALSQGEAQAALVAFVEAFDDHHFSASAPYSAPRRWLWLVQVGSRSSFQTTSRTTRRLASRSIPRDWRNCWARPAAGFSLR